MNRIRLSTSVVAQLLGNARSVRSGITDAALIDEALKALLGSSSIRRAGRQLCRLRRAPR